MRSPGPQSTSGVPASTADVTAILAAIAGMGTRMEDTYVSRREHQQTSDTLSASMEKLATAIEKLNDKIASDVPTRREFDDAMRESRADRASLHGELDKLKDQLHSFEIADTRQLGDMQLRTQQQIGHTQALAYQQGGAAQQSAGSLGRAIQDRLTQIFATAFFSLLVGVIAYLLGHR